MAFTITTESFEGPFDVLLSLVEKRKLFVNDVALSEVTESFLTYVKEHDTELDERTSFLFVAATLLLIKSRSLLPGISLTEEEKESIQDLEDRLKKYEQFRSVTPLLKTLWNRICFDFIPEQKITISPRFVPDERVTKELMFIAIQSVFEQVPKKEQLPQTSVKKTISLDAVISSLEERITKELSLGFRAFSGFHKKPETKEEKVMVIVSFLAMLELARSGIVDLEEAHGDIVIKHRKPEQELSYES